MKVSTLLLCKKNFFAQKLFQWWHLSFFHDWNYRRVSPKLENREHEFSLFWANSSHGEKTNVIIEIVFEQKNFFSWGKFFFLGLSRIFKNFNFFGQKNFFFQKCSELSDSCSKLVFEQKKFCGQKKILGLSRIFENFDYVSTCICK